MTAAMLFAALPAWAGGSRGRVEITPFAGYRIGGEVQHVEATSSAEAAEGPKGAATA
jgi:hypothetical protein